MLVVGGVSYVFMCGFPLIGRACVLALCVRLYIFVSFAFLVLGCGSSAHNEDIVRFRCGGSHKPFLCIFL